MSHINAAPEKIGISGAAAEEYPLLFSPYWPILNLDFVYSYLNLTFFTCKKLQRNIKKGNTKTSFAATEM